jgi:hypothetical protein
MAFLHGGIVKTATGGSISTISGFTVHTFSTPGINTFRSPSNGYVEVLVVGSGGSGLPGLAAITGGGGGGGSVLYQKYIPVLSGVAYTMVIGSAVPNNTGQPGGASTCRYNGGTITAPGGSISGIDNPVGSGGGGSAAFPNGGLGANIIGYGFSGGTGPQGGAGGAGGIGLPGPNGTGGIGLSYSITGVSSYYGGGGGGGSGGLSNPAPSSNNFGYGGGTSTPFIGIPGVIIIRYPA